MINERSPLSNLKSLCYSDNILAKMEEVEHKADDAIMLNTRDKIACASAGNIFIVTHENTVLTPRVEDGILPGITRKLIIEDCKENNIPLIETELAVEDILGAKEVFITNSVLEIQPVAIINDEPVNDGEPGELIPTLKDLYKKRIKKNSIASSEKQYQNPALLVNNFNNRTSTNNGLHQPTHTVHEGEKITLK